ncbi:MAG: M48 family metalloprotease [Fimbriimonadales bacterium]|nr:M48 family metalloprotease [Fimbriimonadales bacterium]
MPLAIRSSPPVELQLALALSLGFLLLLGEFALLFWRLYPLERARWGLTLSRSEYLRLRLGLVFETVAPLVAVGLIALAVTCALHGAQRENAGERLLMSFMGVAGVALGVLYARRGLILPVRTSSLAQPLQTEVQRLGRELGVSVRELLVLDGRRARMANAFALGGGRLAITDYLLAHLAEREALAVLAHEVAHLAQRRRLWRLWLLELGAAGGLIVGLAPIWQQLPAWSHLLLMAMLMVGMAAPMVWLRRRHELEADAFAASQYGADTMKSALLKVAALRTAPSRGATGIHPSLQQRLAHLERLAML